ncbi:hypothetical protein BCR39DRAFT_537005 [Naematelia encephala]|uniref:FAS1 domain-containing protein n=1 Tax=Naematelia encephala TaxID=71784 RepID=A0A1Y2AZ42_9TREE|nr:hypothetical protein BCR39DRAFT_537005 [Naematelia encephala]
MPDRPYSFQSIQCYLNYRVNRESPSYPFRRLMCKSSTRSIDLMKFRHIPPAGQVGIQSEDVLSKFLKSHIVPGIVSVPTNGTVQTLSEDTQISVSGSKDSGWVVAPGNIPVIDFKEVSNGRVFLLDGIVEGSMAADAEKGREPVRRV